MQIKNLQYNIKEKFPFTTILQLKIGCNQHVQQKFH